MTRVGFLASGTGSVMSRVISRFAEDPNVDFCGVVADQTDAGALAVARQAGIRTAVVSRAIGEDPPGYSERLLLVLDDWRPDWILATFNQLLAEPVLPRWSDRIINVHYSLLPAFPGFRPVERSVTFGAKLGGATLHLIDASVDMGPPIMQAVTPISPDDSEGTVQHRLFQYAAIMACQAIAWASEGRLDIQQRGDRKRVIVHGAEYGSLPINPRPEMMTDTLG